MTRQIGVAHLTLLSLTPPELVETAAAAGFDFVGVRVHPATRGERLPAMRPGTPMLRETLARIDATGVKVRDIEFLPITAETGREDWVPALEAGAALGATVFTIAGADTDRHRLEDNIARLVVDAQAVGIRPLVEAISYQTVSTLQDAAAIARNTGAALMLDPLHLQRSGSGFADIGALEPDLIPVLQLCDAPLSAPAPATNGGRTAALQHEARADRMQIGDGQLPLAAMLTAAPPDVPVSIEIPNARTQATMSPLAYATRNAHAARTFVELIDARRGADAGVHHDR